MASESLEMKMKAIGIVHTDASRDDIREWKKGIRSEIEIYPDFAEALDGLEGFSHIFVLAYFNQLRPEQVGPLKVRPRRLLKFGLKPEELPFVGVFALDSPTRPNPVGLSLVPLIRIEGRRLIVSDLDYFDGTPVIDIKPYQPDYRAENYRLAGWHERLLAKVGHV